MPTNAPPATPAKLLARRLKWHRAPVVRGLAADAALAAGTPADPGTDPAPNPPASLPRIDPTGGKWNAGIIRGLSVATIGEAKGRGFWLDSTFLAQTLAAINADPAGKKSRFTHPSMSADGLGSFLGRTTNATLSADGQRVLADLHIDPAAHISPEGNLAAYVMKLAETDPAAFGTSIVFQYDEQATDDFTAANTVTYTDEAGKPRVGFRSPDPANTANLEHARLAELRAVDAVDSPAANPAGLFSGNDFLAQVDGLAAYALGLTNEAPTETALDADPDRFREYVSRFLAARGLAIGPATRPAAPTWEEMAATLARFTTAFGAEKAADYLLAQKLDWPAALEAHLAALTADHATAAERHQAELAALTAKHAAELAAMTKERDELARALAAIPRGLTKPLSQIDPAATPPANPASLTTGLSPAVLRYAQAVKLPTGRPQPAGK